MMIKLISALVKAHPLAFFALLSFGLLAICDELISLGVLLVWSVIGLYRLAKAVMEYEVNRHAENSF